MPFFQFLRANAPFLFVGFLLALLSRSADLSRYVL